MKLTRILDRWELWLPEHRAERPQWPWWEKVRLESMYANIRPGDVVFDIGTEEGDLSALFATWGARLALFEPNPKVWPNIKAIWDANNLDMPHFCWPGFASHVTKTLGELGPRGQWPACAYGLVIGNHGFRHLAEQANVTPQITLDDVAKWIGYFPDVITVDVEGAEWFVLKGAEGILGKKQPLVYISIHPEFMRDLYEMKDSELHDFMEHRGYRGTHLGTDHEEHWLFWHPDGRDPK
jgi:FkbM family methyltransferase